MITRKWQVLIAVLCLAALGLGTFRQVLPRTDYQIAYDFLHDREAAQALRDGENPYADAVNWLESYTPGSELRSYYVYAPTFGLLFIPLTFLPFQAAVIAWATCNLAFLFLIVYSLARAAGWRPSVVATLLLATAASFMAAVRFEIFLGNVDIFMLAAISAGIWARQEKRIVLAGVLIALALTVKPMLALIAVFLLWKREFKLVTSMVIAFGVLFITPFLWLGTKVLSDLLELWHFYSSSYLGFGENVAPRGILERLFTINPVITPVVVAPAVATAIWVVIAAGLFLLTFAMIRPRPLQRDSRSVLEVGAMIVALMLASPLTEAGYLVLLIVPLVGCLSYLRGVAWTRRPFVIAAAATATVWVLELLPRQAEALIWRHIDPNSLVSSDYLSWEPLQFYVLVAAFLVQFYVLGLATGQSVPRAVGSFISNSPELIRDWVLDAWRALPLRGQPARAYSPEPS